MDCDDWDCDEDPACEGGTGGEDCDDGQDNDGDGWTDCDDWDCDEDPACAGDDDDAADDDDDDENRPTTCMCRADGAAPAYPAAGLLALALIAIWRRR